MITRNAQIEHPTWYKFVSFYRGHGSSENRESEIDLIIEENGVLHQIEIKQGTNVNASEAAAFQILDKTKSSKRGPGAIICNCPQPGRLRENVFQIPVWYI